MCQKVITNGFCFCFKCARENNMVKEDGKFKKPTEWEDWIRILYNDEKRFRYWQKKEEAIEIISFNDLEIAGIELFEYGEQFRPLEEDEPNSQREIYNQFKLDGEYYLSEENERRLKARIRYIDRNKKERLQEKQENKMMRLGK